MKTPLITSVVSLVFLLFFTSCVVSTDEGGATYERVDYDAIINFMRFIEVAETPPTATPVSVTK